MAESVELKEQIARVIHEQVAGSDPDERIHHPAQKSWEEPTWPRWRQWEEAADAILALLSAAPSPEQGLGADSGSGEAEPYAVAAANRSHVVPPSEAASPALTDAQIKHMVDRFLGWRLPDNFSPDAGISFKAEFNVEIMASLGKPPMRHQPSGTNLFDARQAEAMVRYMLEGLPSSEHDATEDEMQPPTPLGALRFRMEQGGHTQADLGRLIGSRSHAAEILAGKRTLSKAHIRLLADEWGIPAPSLLGPTPTTQEAGHAE